MNRLNEAKRSKKFEYCIFVIDRMHLRGHVEECHKNFSPNLYEHLEKIGTSINETRNSWISGFNGVTLHMNSMRYIFVFYIVFNEFNKIYSEGHINICDNYKLYKNTKSRSAFDFSDSD